MTKLVIGTRGSKLALTQTHLVASALLELNPNSEITFQTITTKGDKNMAPIPMSTVGKAWFTAEIETALSTGEINLAVHSLKDLAPDRPSGLIALPVLPRSDARDVLISKHGLKLSELPPQAVIGTDSVRRKALLLHARPDVIVESIRGNIQTRLRKLQTEDYDAVVLAAAGLVRMNQTNNITQYLDPSWFVPAIGQGVLAAETTTRSTGLIEQLRSISHDPTNRAVSAEQAFARAIGGSCKLPVGCYVTFSGTEVTILGMAGSNDALECVIRSVTGQAGRAIELATELAAELLELPFMATLSAG